MAEPIEDFREKVAVVTGGASGIGRCLVRELAEAGAHVVIADIDEDAVGALRDELKGADGVTGEVTGLRVDVTREASVESLAEAVFALHPTVHLLFNNAGVGVKEAKRPLWTIPMQDWGWAYSVNVMGVVHGIRAFVPRMIQRGERGHVVNTSSGNGGITSLPTTPVYASSKAAVTSLTEVLHMQLLREAPQLMAHVLFPGPHLVNTNILNSDRVRTEEYRVPGSEPAAYVDMKALAESAGVEFKLTEPEEVAQMALAGLREGRFWILSREGTADARLRARTEQILARENPELP